MVNETRPETTSGLTKKRRRWLKILLVVVLALVVLVGLAPTIISTSWLRKIAVGRINREIEGELSIDSWSIGWFSGVKLEGISLVDQDSEPVASVEGVYLDPSYFSLLGGGPSLGQIIVDRPHLEIRFEPDGQTNVEETIPGLELKLPQRKPSAKRPSFDLKVNGGTVIIHQPEAEPLEIKNIQTQVQMVSADEPLSFQVTCDLTDSRGGGKVSAKGSIPRQNGRFELGQLQTDFQSEVTQFELGLLSPILQRAGADLKVSGRLDGQIEGHIQELHSVQLSGQAVCPDIYFSGPALKTDNFHIREFAGELDIDRQDNELVFRSLQLSSDLGAIKTTGVARFKSEGERFELDSMQLEGSLSGDLPKILNQLPATVRLRSGLKVTGGDFQAKYDFNRSGIADKLTGTAVLKDLQGTVEQRIVQLDEAVELGFDVSRDEEGLEIGQLSLNSGFGQLSASGKTAAFGFEGRFELAKLHSQMSGFIDLGNLSFEGQLFCKGDILRNDKLSEFSLNATGLEVVVSGLGRQDIREPRLLLNLVGSFSETDEKQGAVVNIRKARLVSEVGEVGTSGQIHLRPLDVRAQVQLNSNLDKLWNLAAVFKDLPADVKISGRLGSELQLGTVSPEEITCSGSTRLRGLEIIRKDKPTLTEPEILLKHQLNYDLKSKALGSDMLELSLAGLKALIEKLEVAQRDGGDVDVKAEGKFQADIAKLRPWMLALGKLDAKTDLSGQSSGQFFYSRTAGKEHVELASEIVGLQVQTADQKTFDEPKIIVALDGDADRVSRLFEIRQFKVDSSFLQAVAVASSGVGQGGSEARINLQGQCDLVRLSQLVRPWKPDFPSLRGSGSADMNLRGPAPQTVGSAWVQTLSGPGIVRFDQQLLSGLSIGPAEIKMQADQGYLTIGPTDVPTNEGAMTIRARVGLAGKKPFLAIGEPTQLLGDVQVNPQMSEHMLKFVNPIFANNNQVSGTVDFLCNSLVIDDPKTWKQDARMSGQFSGKDLRLQSRGGLMHDLTTILGLDLSAQLGQLKPATIELANGVVSYEDMHIVFGSVVDLSFSGRVGLNGKLDLKLGVPVLPAMLGSNPELMKYIGDQRIYLPITGTVNNPKLDIEALPKALEPLISEALKILALEQIGEFFEDILKPKQRTVPAPKP